MQGKTVNGYTLKRRIGSGGMAEVWYAENEIGKAAAVKVLHENLSNNPQIVERFHNEALLMVKLNHPNIRQVYGYGYIKNRHCIIMEYLEGSDLETLLKEGRRFSEEDLRRWWNQITHALKYTHAMGIVHRDIKPSNLFMDNWGNIKLLDFGIAKIKEGFSVTQTGAVMGTLMYMSPEQVKDSKNIDFHTDIYSLAVTFIHLLSGKEPYDSANSDDYSIRKSIVEQKLDLSGIPASWRSFLKPYLAKNPADRPALQAFQSSQPPTSNSQPKSKKTRWLILGGAALAVAAGVVAVLLMLRDPFKKTDQWLTESEQIFSVYNVTTPLDDYTSNINWLNKGYASYTQALQALEGMKGYDTLAFALRVKRCDSLGPLYIANVLESVDKELLKLSIADDTLAALARLRQLEEFDYFKNDSAGMSKLEAIENVIDFLCHAELFRYYSNGKYGFIDLSGKTVITPQFEYADVFAEGLAKAKMNGKWGFINKLGTFVTKPEFDDVEAFSEGLAKVKVGNKFGYINKYGDTIVPIQYDILGPFKEGLARIRSNGKYGYIDHRGDTIIDFKYENAYNFAEDLAPVKTNGKWHFINKKDEYVFNDLQFDGAWSFSESLAAVKIGDHWGFINKLGKLTIPAEYDEVGSFYEGMAKIKKDEKWGYVDKSGKIIDPKFDEEYTFSEGLAAVKTENGWGFIDKSGKMVIPAGFDEVKSFSEGLAAVKINDKWYYIDKRVNYKFSTQYEYAYSFSNGLARVKYNGKQVYINLEGTIINKD